MTRDEFDQVVRRLEGISARNPKRYIGRVVGLVLLAYGYLGLMLLGSLALALACIALMFFVPNGATIKLGIVGIVLFGGFFIAVARGLWVRLEPPQGLRVTRHQAPALFGMLDELRGALDCEPFHEVVLIGEHNAAVIQIPRLGVFGWHRNYLLIGLPLMQSLAPDEFKAVLAHEFAHSSRGHGRFGNWLYRVRRTWDRIFEQMSRQGTRGRGILLKFVNWFWPIFNAHAFVLARANEYEADACSVRIAGADAAARALMRLPIDGNLLSEKFWPDIYAMANKQKHPPENVFVSLPQTLKAGPLAEDASRWLHQAFLYETNNGDTHPSLKDRLRAIGRLPEGAGDNPTPLPPVAPVQSAAEVYLESHAPIAAQQLSEDWRKDITFRWMQRYEAAQKLEADLAELDKPSDAPPSAEALWKRARTLLDLHGDREALPVIRQILALDAQHAAANFVCGRELLSRDQSLGIQFMEKAAESDPLMTGDVIQLIYAYYVRNGQRDKLRELEDRLDRFQDEAQAAQRERNVVTAADSFDSPDLNVEQQQALWKLFQSEPEIGEVAVARKWLRHFKQRPCFVIAMKIKTSWWKPRSSSSNKQLVDRVLNKVELPGNFLVFVVEGNLKALGKKVYNVPGSVIYGR